MLKAIHDFKKKNKKGFTLIELLIVVAIIAILAAIAIPQFAAYRIRGFNAAANSDIRNAKTAEEALFADFQSYGNEPAGVVFSPTNLTLTTEDSSTNTRTLTSGLSNNVGAEAIGGNNIVGYASRWQSYLVFGKHSQGDRTFGADGNMPTIYWMAGGAGTPYAASGLASSTDPDLTAAGYTAL